MVVSEVPPVIRSLVLEMRSSVPGRVAGRRRLHRPAVLVIPPAAK
jgi:hypothetical protein